MRFLLQWVCNALLNDLNFKEYNMTIYQVLDEQNHPVFETKSFMQAQQEAELLNYSFDDHYFFVEAAATTKPH